MVEHIDYDDPKYPAAAEAILQRHNAGEHETNITTAIRDFLVFTKLATSEEIREEVAPSLGSRKAVDLTALDTFIEVKRRIGTTGGFSPNPDYVEQIDDYLAESEKHGRVRMGVLTDGKYWLLRWPNAGPVKTALPYGFVLDSPEKWIPLFEWLRDSALSAMDDREPDRASMEERFGPNSPSYQRDIDALRDLYARNASAGTIAVKRQLWQDLLKAALGELASTPEQLDHLFVRHTYLTAVIGMVVQARFGLNIAALAAANTADLLQGADFRSKTGLQGIVESDFFTWPTEVDDGLPLLKTLARAVTRFNWSSAPTDIAAILYETVIPQDERKQLGEYYTPDWLARSIVEEIVTKPLEQEVLDPTCGSGTFIAEAVRHFLEAARETLSPRDTLEWLRFSITGIDIHPVAVHLARAAWVLAAQPALQAAAEHGLTGTVTAPIYLGDSLQIRHREGDMFSAVNVSVEVGDEANTRLEFPRQFVENAETFDAFMGDIVQAIEGGNDPLLALNDHNISDTQQRETLKETISALQRLHAEGRNHIWAYYTRNLVRPVVLSQRKVDVIVGNPPWLIYRDTADTLRAELEQQSRDRYGIWVGGVHANHQDISSLFFATSVDLYLKDGGLIGMVLPHSALRTGQHSKWRTGSWVAKPSGRGRNRMPGRVLSVDFSHKMAWDLAGLKDKDNEYFFPMPASVVFAKRIEGERKATPLEGEVELWLGEAGPRADRSTRADITQLSAAGGFSYASLARNGAGIYPRPLFYVEKTTNPAIVQIGQTATVNPRRGAYDKKPWSRLDLTDIAGNTVESKHIYEVYLGETLAPYVTLEPLRAVLPVRRAELEIPRDKNGVGGIRISDLESRMRDRWRIVSRLWENNKSANEKKNLLDQLDYFGKLTSQLKWRDNSDARPIRVIYGGWGTPTAALLLDDDAIVDYTLFWIACKDKEEAYYLLAIINSRRLYKTILPFMPKGQFGPRHLQKLLWKLPIPAFDPTNALHTEISAAGVAAEAGAARELAALRAARGKRGKVSVKKARNKLREWHQGSPEGAAVEAAVSKLLSP